MTETGDVQEGLDLDVLPGGALAALEALLLITEEPLEVSALAQALALPFERIEALLGDLAREYEGFPDADGAPTARVHGFALRHIGGGWRLYSRPEFHSLLSGFVLAGQTSRLSQAALETLAVVAYRQPVSRARISAVRGVSVDGVVRTLVTRGLITEVDTDPVTGGYLYGTTALFLESMGLNSLDELPDLAPYLPDGGEQSDPGGATVNLGEDATRK